VITREQILSAARECLGTPFHHQGRVCKAGLDCIGLMVYIAKKLNLFFYDNTTYSREPMPGILIPELEKVLTRVSPEKMKAGDVLVFWMNKKTKFPQHIGICTDRGMIHTWAGVKKVVEHKFSDRWKERLLYVFRFPGVES